MENLTFAEIKELKKVLETEINLKFKEFESKTHVKIDGISTDKGNFYALKPENQNDIYYTRIDIKLKNPFE